MFRIEVLYRGTHPFCLVNYYFGLRYTKKRSASRPWDPSGSWIFGAGGHRRAAHALTGLSGLRGLVEGRALPDIVVNERGSSVLLVLKLSMRIIPEPFPSPPPCGREHQRFYY